MVLFLVFRLRYHYDGTRNPEYNVSRIKKKCNYIKTGSIVIMITGSMGIGELEPPNELCYSVVRKHNYILKLLLHQLCFICLNLLILKYIFTN